MLYLNLYLKHKQLRDNFRLHSFIILCIIVSFENNAPYNKFIYLNLCDLPTKTYTLVLGQRYEQFTMFSILRLKLSRTYWHVLCNVLKNFLKDILLNDFVLHFFVKCSVHFLTNVIIDFIFMQSLVKIRSVVLGRSIKK